MGSGVLRVSMKVGKFMSIRNCRGYIPWMAWALIHGAFIANGYSRTKCQEPRFLLLLLNRSVQFSQVCCSLFPPLAGCSCNRLGHLQICHYAPTLSALNFKP